MSTRRVQGQRKHPPFIADSVLPMEGISWQESLNTTHAALVYAFGQPTNISSSGVEWRLCFAGAVAVIYHQKVPVALELNRRWEIGGLTEDIVKRVKDWLAYCNRHIHYQQIRTKQLASMKEWQAKNPDRVKRYAERQKQQGKVITRYERARRRQWARDYYQRNKEAIKAKAKGQLQLPLGEPS